MLHLTPPMSAPDELRQCKKLVNEAGYLEVNNDTLQSTRYPNIFSIGDCNSAPTSKTAAAVGMYSVYTSCHIKNLSFDFCENDHVLWIFSCI